MTILDKIKDRRSYKGAPLEEEEKQSEDTSEDDSFHTVEDTSNKVSEVNNDAIINTEGILENTIYEIKYMITYALNKGKEIPEDIHILLESNHLKNIFSIHAQLCKTILPATPETIEYLNNYYNVKKKRILFSPIPLVRYFIIIAIMAIIALIGSGLSADVNTETLSKGILNNSGMSLFKNLLFLCSGSLIGVVFFLLSKLTNAVKQATLTKDDNTYYWAMLIMGMLSGLIMSEVIVLNETNLEEQSVEMNRLLFALLGGFSSEVVYGILQSIMDKVRNVLGGDK